MDMRGNMNGANAEQAGGSPANHDRIKNDFVLTALPHLSDPIPQPALPTYTRLSRHFDKENTTFCHFSTDGIRPKPREVR